MVLHSHHTAPVHRHAAHNAAGITGVVLGSFAVVTGALAFLFPVAAVSPSPRS